MAIATTAPAISTAEIGTVLSKGGEILATGGRVVVAGASTATIALGSIFASQSLGVDSDKIPGAWGQSDVGLDQDKVGIFMGSKTKAKPKVNEKTDTCSDTLGGTPSNKKCKEEEHRGNIQAQEGTDMLCGKNAPTPAAAKWNLKVPPSHAFLMLTIAAVRAQISQLMSSSYQEGADTASTNLIAYYSAEGNILYGIQAEDEVYSYFNGIFKHTRPAKFKGKDSRRIDGSVFKGRVMGPGAI